MRRSGGRHRSGGSMGVLGEGPGMFNMQGLLGQAPGMGGGGGGGGGGMGNNFRGGPGPGPGPGMFGGGGGGGGGAPMGNMFGRQGNVDPIMHQQQLRQQLQLRDQQLAFASTLLSQQNHLMDTMGSYGRGRGGGGVGMDFRSKRFGGVDGRGPDTKRRRYDEPHYAGDRGRSNQYQDRNRTRDHDRDRRRPGSSDSSRRTRTRGARRDFTAHGGRDQDEDVYDPAEPTADEDELCGDLDDGAGDEENGADGDGLGGTRRRQSGSHEGTGEEEMDEKSIYFCHACNTECFTDRNFTAHMQGSHHRQRMEGLLNLHSHKSSQLVNRMKAEEHLRLIENKDKKRGFCKICDGEIPLPYERHKSTPLHKQRYQQVKRGCGWCEVYDFKNFSEVLKHRETEQHQTNKAKFDRRASKNSDDSEAKKNSDEMKTEEEKKAENSGDSQNGEPAPKKASLKKKTGLKDGGDVTEDFSIPPYDPETPIGQKFIIPTAGFFCTLCQKFYSKESAAREVHCKSRAHYDKYEKVLQQQIKMNLLKKQKAEEEEAQARAEESIMVIEGQEYEEDHGQQQQQQQQPGEEASQDQEMEDGQQQPAPESEETPEAAETAEATEMEEAATQKAEDQGEGEATEEEAALAPEAPASSEVVENSANCKSEDYALIDLSEEPDKKEEEREEEEKEEEGKEEEEKEEEKNAEEGTEEAEEGTEPAVATTPTAGRGRGRVNKARRGRSRRK